MSTDDLITTDLDFEHLLSSLLGKQRFHGASGHLDAPTWREQLVAIIAALRKAVRETVRGDDRHCREIQQRCDDAIAALKAAHSTGALSVTAVEHLTRIAFMLVGHFPSNWGKAPAVAGHPRTWNLSQFRTLRYERTPEQMFQQILALARQPRPPHDLPTERELWDSLVNTHKHDYRAFLQWFKATYPSHYLEFV